MPGVGALGVGCTALASRVEAPEPKAQRIQGLRGPRNPELQFGVQGVGFTKP